MDKFDATIGFTVKTADGKPYCDCVLNYYGMSYASLAVVEHAFIGALVELNEVANARASTA